jgi:hypothetical protein
MVRLIAALVASALILVFSMEVRRASERSHPPIQHQSATATSHGAGERVDEPLVRYTYWLTVFTAVLAFATIGLWLATLGLYFAGERNLKFAKETSDRQAAQIQSQIDLARNEFLATHRPKIRIKHFMLANDIWQGQPITANLTCLNNGTADAIPQQVGLRYEVVKEGGSLPLDPAITGRGVSGGRVGCGLNWRIEKLDADRTLASQESADIQQGRSKLYCVGFVSYLDGSGRMRITGFCRVLNLQSGRFDKVDDPDYEYED